MTAALIILGVLAPDQRAVVAAIERVCRGETPDCPPALVAIGWHESRLMPAPQRRGTGCGWAQTLADVPFTVAGRRSRTPICRALERPDVAARWAWLVLAAKAARCAREGRAGWPCAFERYNGSRGRVAYARRVLATFERLRAAGRVRGPVPTATGGGGSHPAPSPEMAWRTIWTGATDSQPAVHVPVVRDDGDSDSARGRHARAPFEALRGAGR